MEATILRLTPVMNPFDAIPSLLITLEDHRAWADLINHALNAITVPGFARAITSNTIEGIQIRDNLYLVSVGDIWKVRWLQDIPFNPGRVAMYVNVPDIYAYTISVIASKARVTAQRNEDLSERLFTLMDEDENFVSKIADEDERYKTFKQYISEGLEPMNIWIATTHAEQIGQMNISISVEALRSDFDSWYSLL